MILFFVGIIEMTISAMWTKSVAKAEVLSNGAITGVHLLIWYFVLQKVVENLGDWTTIIPYMLGCMLGSMIGAMDRRTLKRKFRKAFRVRKATKPQKKAVPVTYPTLVEYERL
jgi:hypothetical protein